MECDVLLVEGRQEVETMIVAFLPSHLDILVVATLAQSLNQKLWHKVILVLIMSCEVN